MSQNNGNRTRNISLVGILTIIGVFIALAAFLQDSRNSKAQENVQSTLIAISGSQLAAQQTLIVLQQDSSSSQDIANIQATIAILENERRILLSEPTLSPEVSTLALPTESTVANPPTIATTQSPIPDLGNTATNSLEAISFSAPGDVQSLNPVFGWQPGNAIANSYDLTLNPGTLTLVAAGNTDQWQGTNSAPFIVFPIRGNFVVSVKVAISPTQNYQRAGIGIRSTENINTWVSITRNYHSNVGGQANIVLSNQQGRSELLNNNPYSRSECYFKIERRGSIVDLSYSENGVNWIVLQDNYVANFTEDVEIFLMVSSTASLGITAQFSDFTLTRLP